MFLSAATGGNAWAEGSRADEARALVEKRKWAEAAVALRGIIKEEPANSRAVIDLARALTYSGRREEALGALTRAVDREKGARRSALMRRTRVISRLFLSNAAFQAYQEGVNFLSARKYRDAQKQLERALDLESSNVEILVRLGQSLAMEGDYDSAAERLRLAKALNPFEPELKLWLGRSLHQRGELPEAIEELRSAYESLPGSELAPAWYAEALSSASQRIAAIQLLEGDTRDHPFHLVGLITLARLRLQGAAPHESQPLWEAKRDLQVAMSRLEKYPSSKSEGELSVDLRDPTKLKSDIQALIQGIDSRISAQSYEN